MREYERAHDLLAHPWAITEPAFRRVIASALAFESNPNAFGFLFTQPAQTERRPYELCEGAAVIEISGVLSRRASYFSSFLGRSTYRGISDAFESALEDGAVESILLSIDSPGGDALGIAELADRIYESRGVKPITAVVRGVGASAAYYLASAAGRVVVARDAMVGSIGCMATYIDWSKFDAEMGIEEITIVASQSPRKNPDPTTDGGRAQLQVEVDDVAQQFIEAVARYRGVSVDQVLSGFGQGGIFVGQKAVDAGLADALGTLRTILSKGGAWEVGMESVKVSEISAEWLAQHVPAVASQIRSEGERVGREAAEQEASARTTAAVSAACDQARVEAAAAERERILGIEEAALPGHEALIASLKRDPQATPAAAALAIVKAEREKGAGVLAQLRSEEDELVAPEASATPAAPGAESSTSIVDRVLQNAKRAGVIA